MSTIERIEKLYRHLGFRSLRSFASVLGINAQVFYDIRADKCQISKEVASIIQDKFKNVSIEWLMTGKGQMLEDMEADCDSISKEIISSLKETIQAQRETIDYQKEIIQMLKAEKGIQSKSVTKDAHTAYYPIVK